MAWIGQSEHGIGRGEIAESHIEAPIFAFFMFACAVGLFIQHLIVQDFGITIALTVSLLVFGTTVVRVDYGLYILLIAMMLSPEIQAGAVGGNNERGVNLRYDDILIIIIFLGVLVKHAFEGRPLLWRPNPINPGIFAYYGVCVISTLLALKTSVNAWDKEVAFFVMLKMFEFYLIFFMVGMSIVSMKQVKKQLVVFFIVSLIVCGYGIFSIGNLPRVSAPFEAGGTEPNTLGGYLMVVMAVSTALYLYAPNMKLKITLALTTVVAFVPLLMTLSRASYMALFVTMSIIGLASRRVIFLFLLAAVIIASPFIMPDDVVSRVTNTFQPSGVAIDLPGVENAVTIDKSAYERIYIWKKVRYNLKIWPWFGGGISWDTVLDSQFARVLIESGLFGFATFVFLLWRIVFTANQGFRWSRNWIGKGLSLGMFATTLGLIVHSFGTISFLIVRIMEPFWFLIALTCVAREIAYLDHMNRLAEHQERLKLKAIEEEAAANRPPELEGVPVAQRA